MTERANYSECFSVSDRDCCGSEAEDSLSHLCLVAEGWRVRSFKINIGPSYHIILMFFFYFFNSVLL